MLLSPETGNAWAQAGVYAAEELSKTIGAFTGEAAKSERLAQRYRGAQLEHLENVRAQYASQLERVGQLRGVMAAQAATPAAEPGGRGYLVPVMVGLGAIAVALVVRRLRSAR